ncbi:hypothetical protein GS467_06525 [Rhodococcus hoagii]|nr:hypothetical protein [Prescottella equi]
MPAVLGFIAAFVALALILTYWKLLVGILVLAAVAVAAYLTIGEWRFRRQKRIRIERGRASRLAARAETQHEQYLAGDERGLYGNYRPADLD